MLTKRQGDIGLAILSASPGDILITGSNWPAFRMETTSTWRVVGGIKAHKWSEIVGWLEQTDTYWALY